MFNRKAYEHNTTQFLIQTQTQTQIQPSSNEANKESIRNITQQMLDFAENPMNETRDFETPEKEIQDKVRKLDDLLSVDNNNTSGDSNEKRKTKDVLVTANSLKVHLVNELNTDELEKYVVEISGLVIESLIRGFKMKLLLKSLGRI